MDLTNDQYADPIADYRRRGWDHVVCRTPDSSGWTRNSIRPSDLTVILVGFGSEAAEHWLRPAIGYWTYGVEFAGSAIIVMLFLQLTFWRSLLVVVVFWAVFVAGIIFVGVVGRQHADIQPNQRASGKGGIPSLLAIERARPALPEHNRSTWNL